MYAIRSYYEIDKLPDLKNPLLIAGFEGWGNALKISSGMAGYFVRKFNAQRFAEINPDLFFRYDEMRPVVHIEEGVLKNLTPPGGAFYAAQTASGARDLVILKSDEPQLRWSRFVQDRITSYNVCYTKLLRAIAAAHRKRHDDTYQGL